MTLKNKNNSNNNEENDNLNKKDNKTFARIDNNKYKESY